MLMQDMFSGELTAPADEPDYSAGFDAFWKAWPSGTRKVGKPQALAKWIKRRWCEQAERIIGHVEHMKKQPDWQKDNGAFIPMVCTYLNQERWSGWTPPAKPAVDVIAATRAIWQERDRTAAPIPADVRAKLQAMRNRPSQSASDSQ